MITAAIEDHGFGEYLTLTCKVIIPAEQVCNEKFILGPFAKPLEFGDKIAEHIRSHEI